MLFSQRLTSWGAVVVACLLSSTHAWTSKVPSGSGVNPQVSRKSMLVTLVQGGVASAAAFSLVQQVTPLPAFAAESLPSGVTYEVVKKGDGPKPEIGELVAIRFAAYFGDRKIDDIFDSPEPYYTRLGSGGLLKGVESTLPEMRVGDRWKLNIPVSILDYLEVFRQLTVWNVLNRIFASFLAMRNRELLPSALKGGMVKRMLRTNEFATNRNFTPVIVFFLTCTDLLRQESQESPRMLKLRSTSKWWPFPEKNRN